MKIETAFLGYVVQHPQNKEVFTPAEIEIVDEIAERLLSGKGVTQAQADTVLALMEKLDHAHPQHAVTSALADVRWVREPIKSPQKKVSEARKVSSNRIAVRFAQMNPVLRNKLKQLPSLLQHHRPLYHAKNHIWLITLSRTNVRQVTALLDVEEVQCDEETLKVLANARAAIGQPTNVSIDPESREMVVHVPDDEVLAAWFSTFAKQVDQP